MYIKLKNQLIFQNILLKLEQSLYSNFISVYLCIFLSKINCLNLKYFFLLTDGVHQCLSFWCISSNWLLFLSVVMTLPTLKKIVVDHSVFRSTNGHHDFLFMQFWLCNVFWCFISV